MKNRSSACEERNKSSLVVSSSIMGDARYSFSLTTFSPQGQYFFLLELILLTLFICLVLLSFFSLLIFSGELVQIKYALNAVAAGSTAVGIKGIIILFSLEFLLSLSFLAVDGVVIAVEKKLPELTDVDSVKLIEMLTENIGVTYAGIGPDFRLLVRLGRKKAQDYFRWFKEPIPVLMMVKEMANIMQEYTQSGFEPLYYILLVSFPLLTLTYF